MILIWSISPTNSIPIYLTIVAFSLIEIIRFPFYTLKQVESKPSFFQNFFGDLRYNIFIIIYPIGALCEILAAFSALPNLANQDGSDKYSLAMPNRYNFAFSYRYYIYSMPVIYAFGFTSNYLYMFG